MRIFYFTLISLIASTDLCLGQTVKINEMMDWNTTALKDGSGNYSPWIELYNVGPTAINLQGYYLADHSYDLLKWKFPNINIPAGGYQIIYISGKKTGAPNEIHCDISLNSTSTPWQGIYISDPSGNMIDHYDYVSMGINISYGRSPDGGSSFAFFGQATPGMPNTTPTFSAALPAPAFSQTAGFYENSFDLSIFSPDPAAEIRYTLDGSEPTSASSLYVGPITIKNRSSDPNGICMIQSTFNSYWVAPTINIEKYTVIKARAFKSGHLPGEVITSTYFVDSNIKNRFKMPVISLSTDASGLFDYVKGIYVTGKIFADSLAAHPAMPIDGNTPANFKQHGADWNRQSHVEFFEHSGVLGFSQTMSVNIHGAYSRLYRQHALNLKGGKGFDDPNSVKYPIFPGLVQTTGMTQQKYLVSKDITKFGVFMIRNNGSDWGYSMFRDALGQYLFAHRMQSTQAYRPCVVYLNGEYWGIHDLREKLDQDYLVSHYGVPKTSSTILYNEGILYKGDTSAIKDYRDLVSYISSNDMSQSSNYDYVKTKMDVENYAEFYVAEIYLNNRDWPGSNIRYWRKNTPYNPNSDYGHDGRWRWGLQDLDMVMSSNQPNGDYTYNTLQEVTATGGTVQPNPDWSTVVFRNLLKNQEFRNLFINYMADHMNSSLKPKRVVDVIDRFRSLIEPEMPAHIARWNAPADMNFWYADLAKMKNFATMRPQFQFQHNLQYFGLNDTVHVTLNVSDQSHGKIRINQIEVDEYLPGVNQNVYPWQGTYYKNVPVKLYAMAYPGYKFARWEGTINSTNQVIILGNTSNEQVTAIFEVDSPFEPNSANVNLYPNPAVGSLNIDFTDDNNGDIYIFVYDRLGKEVYCGGINKLSKTVTTQIDVSNFHKGLHILHVRSSTGKLYKKKFMVEK
ncbi:MAG TPA: CotH kinase family protein [Cytophagaceae bacterium]|nr:CotH kinase family protein [Cytophagaceae bacterium]